MRLRRLQPDEVEPLRDLRLRALREDPGAFAETFEEARARPPENWASWAADESLVIVVAIDGDRWVGMVAGRLLRRTAPGCRRCGWTRACAAPGSDCA